jgi:hypothetical protein
MATGTISFVAPIAGLRFIPIEVSSPHSVVEKIVLEAQDDERVESVFHLTDVFDFEEAEAIASSILPSIINRLAFYRNVSVGEPYPTGATLPKDASGTHYTVTSQRRILWESAAPVLTLGEDARQDLARLLEQPYTRHDLYSAYRFALNQSDPVARFMFLYNILLQLNNDSQPQVDAFIRSKMPSVPQSPRPDREHIVETIYTRLRNEVGHRRPGSRPEETRGEIQDNAAQFQELVRTAISHVV